MVPANISDFGAAVKKALIDKRMRQIDLAELVGIPPAYMSHIITGRKSGAKYRPAIIRALDLEEFGSEDKPPSSRAS
ncbi:MAG: helix-turn-helix domain-containing protein [Oscillospiraceae bacterium]|nr:helix-turn-helix domain-containing protein [Oscillospiraceae bacterium]